MFYHISGTLCHREPGVAVIDCGGVGYKLTVSDTTAAALDAEKEAGRGENPKVRLFTYLAVREDNVELFGFYTYAELSAFKMLISVSSVGPKAAMSLLSTMTPENLALAICTENTKLLSRAPGIGGKTAARIVLELKDKLSRESAGAKAAESLPGAGLPPSGRGKLAEAQDALAVLGYDRGEIADALRGIDPGLELEEIIRAALKKFIKD